MSRIKFINSKKKTKENKRKQKGLAFVSNTTCS
jgi:hypothetical protein